jgi:hypothetical protein
MSRNGIPWYRVHLLIWHMDHVTWCHEKNKHSHYITLGLGIFFTLFTKKQKSKQRIKNV